MDTSEAEQVANIATKSEPLPVYDSSHDSWNILSILEQHSALNNGQWVPIIDCEFKDLKSPEEIKACKQNKKLVCAFFEAVEKKESKVVEMLIEQKYVTANTKNHRCTTALLIAVDAGNVSMVQELLDFGADVNAYGRTPAKFRYMMRYESDLERPHNEYGEDKIYRTPLQHAAQKGNLVLVKLLMEVYHADDSLVAPDGEIALRLAAAGGHREIVEYLPARRAGGWKRWTTQNQKSIHRAKKAFHDIYKFNKCLFYGVPRVILWEVPRWLVLKVIKPKLLWVWMHRMAIIRDIPRLCDRCLRAVWGNVKDLPKDLWVFFTNDLPKALWRLVKRIPKLISHILRWAWQRLRSFFAAVKHAIERLAILLLTTIEAIWTFFRNLSLQDLWNSFCDVLEAIFVRFPKLLSENLESFVKLVGRCIVVACGSFGQVLVWLVELLYEGIIYIPRKLWTVIKSLGSSLGKGLREVKIWFNPKAG